MARVAKWGNSLAMRLPQSLVEALSLKIGDDLEVTVVGKRTVEVAPKMTREEALESLKASRVPLPQDYKFDRDEANAR